MNVTEKEYLKLTERILKEDKKLRKKISKLERFILEHTGELDETMFYILSGQYSCMTGYHFMLRAKLNELGFHLEEGER